MFKNIQYGVFTEIWYLIVEHKRTVKANRVTLVRNMANKRSKIL